MTNAGVGASKSPTNVISLRGVMAPNTQPTFKVNKVKKTKRKRRLSIPCNNFSSTNFKIQTLPINALKTNFK